MKKIPLASQIFLLILLILLISTVSFSFIAIPRIKAVAEEETYARLLNYATFIEKSEDANLPQFSEREVAYVLYRNETEIFSKNWNKFISESDLNGIVSDLDEPKNVLQSKMKNASDETIYYLLIRSDTSMDYLLVLTDASYVNRYSRGLSTELMLVFLAIIILASLILAIWSLYFTKRIHRLQAHILSLPKENYQKEYRDTSMDELGVLSQSIEKMRVEILQNEQTKREMLQNISHDFKTPLAVIQSYAEAFQDHMADEGSAQIILNQTEILKNKVNRLLQYHSLEYLSKDKALESVDMKEVVESVLEEYKYQISVEVEKDLQDHVFFKGYRENYVTVVENLLDNAKRYAKTRIRIVLKKGRLRIYNDGEWIEEQFLNGNFRPYEKGKSGQFGLGLSIVTKTLDFFGMDFSVKNEEHGGVSFIITETETE